MTDRWEYLQFKPTFDGTITQVEYRSPNGTLVEALESEKFNSIFPVWETRINTQKDALIQILLAGGWDPYCERNYGRGGEVMHYFKRKI